MQAEGVQARSSAASARCSSNGGFHPDGMRKAVDAYKRRLPQPSPINSG